MRVPPDGQIHTLTEANRFYNLSHAICYSYWTDKNGDFSLTLTVALTTGQRCRVACDKNGDVYSETHRTRCFKLVTFISSDREPQTRGENVREDQFLSPPVRKYCRPLCFTCVPFFERLPRRSPKETQPNPATCSEVCQILKAASEILG